MPRSPELFDGLLKNVHSTNSTPFLRTCQQSGSTYSVPYQYLRNNLVDLPFVLSIEDLSSPITRAILMAKMSAFINNKLGSRVDFSGQVLKLVNTGNHHGADAIDTTAHHVEGVYAISGHRPILSQTRDYIRHCGTECNDISTLANHNYECV